MAVETAEKDVELERLRAELRCLALDNARLYQDAQEANQAKADFLAVVSHELLTPLNAILGYSDLLDANVSGAMTAQQQNHVSRIRASARHLLQLVEEILSFARLHEIGEEIRLERILAEALAREAAAVMEPLAIAKGLEFEVIPHGKTVDIETDVGKARQLLVNLLSNAVKFTDSGRVELCISFQGDQVLFTIRDTGRGIPREQVQRIFDPFWQVDPPNTRRVGGTGLGLSVSLRFAHLLGGDIAVETEPGVGTTFTVRLPVRVPAPPAKRETASSLALAKAKL